MTLAPGVRLGPGEKPAIQMWSQGVDSLEFRVYRVKDPILFFQKLEDVHRFGTGSEPRKAKVSSWRSSSRNSERRMSVSI